MRTMVRGFACLCMFLLVGCATTHHSRRTAVFLDVAASSEWRADHRIVASWQGRRVELPAYITFQRLPSAITYGGFSDFQGTRVEFGTTRFDISSEPVCSLTFYSPSSQEGRRQEAIWRSGIAYWALCPADPNVQSAQWTVPTPDELKSRIASGKVRTVPLVSP